MTRRILGGAVLLCLAGLAAGAPAVAQDQAAMRGRGKQLFTDQGCYGCHVIDKYGTPIAPDLSRVGSKYGVEDLTRWLRDPTAQKPTAHMPRIAMPEADARALAAYLAGLR